MFQRVNHEFRSERDDASEKSTEDIIFIVGVKE
jgi:hypothetical protein